MNAREIVEKWQQMRMLAFDIESTGTNPHEDRAVTATIVEFNHARPTASNWIIDPGIPIPEEAAAVHGWTTDRLKAHPGVRIPEQACFEISARLALWMGKGFPVVAFNAAYDFTLLEAENRRHGLPTLRERLAPKPVGPIIDPMVLDRHVDQYRKMRPAPTEADPDARVCECGCGAPNKTLAGCCIHYGVPLVAAHTSESDAASAVRLVRAIITRHPQRFRGFTVGGLHMAQVRWRREQQDGLRAFFDRVGKEHDGCPGEWPLLPAPAPALAAAGGVR